VRRARACGNRWRARWLIPQPWAYCFCCCSVLTSSRASVWNHFNYAICVAMTILLITRNESPTVGYREHVTASNATCLNTWRRYDMICDVSELIEKLWSRVHNAFGLTPLILTVMRLCCSVYTRVQIYTLSSTFRSSCRPTSPAWANVPSELSIVTCLSIGAVFYKYTSVINWICQRYLISL